MSSETRSHFLKYLGLAGAGLASGTADALPGQAAHGVIVPIQADVGAERMWHGYPDESYSLTSFADSLTALAWGYGWYPQPPFVSLRNVIVVDFISATQEQAEASIARGWHGAWEFPMGNVNTLASAVRTNAQNERFERHLTFIATGMAQCDFHREVIEPLLDARTCHIGDCRTCCERTPRDFAEALIGMAYGTDQAAIQLFARWRPSHALTDRLAASGVELRAHSLGEIPKEDLEANRVYHLWSGTPQQAETFRRSVWAPAWRRKEAT